MDKLFFDGKLSVIIPAYDEGEIIRRSIRETAHELENWGVSYEIIAVDDGSADKANVVICL